MNIVTVNVFRRPFLTRLCLESLARAQRWSGGWASEIQIAFACNHAEHPEVKVEVDDVISRNPDINWSKVFADSSIPSTPHAMSKWMIDYAFGGTVPLLNVVRGLKQVEMVLYVEDDAIVSPDAFLMCEFTKREANAAAGISWCTSILGCCLYHETIPEQYVAEGRPEGPDPRLLHLGNGLNTCGGTAFLREPYLRFLSPEWNCKLTEPKGFDYSAHFLMYVHGLYMVWPDFSRSINLGFESGSLSHDHWKQYFGRSLWVQTAQAVEGHQLFRSDGAVPPPVREEWMIPEMAVRGML